MGLKNEIDNVLRLEWKSSKENSLNAIRNTAFAKNGRATTQAVFLYADLRKSSQLASDNHRKTAGKVVKAYLYAMSKIISDNGGDIVSFDGDRVMGVFLGSKKETQAGRTVLKMNHALKEFLQPCIKQHFNTLEFEVKHGIGVDVGTVDAIWGGIKDGKDLVWIGKAPNFAAKLSSIRNSPYLAYITKAVYDKMDSSLKNSNGKKIWSPGKSKFLSKKHRTYRTSEGIS